jgi:hypothetical protein
MLDAKNTKQYLEKFGKTVVDKSKKNLPQSQELKKSIDYDVPTATMKSIDLDFYMEDYGEFQDRGVQGADPSALPEYSKYHGVNRAPNSPFKFGTGTAPKKQFKLAINGWLIRKGIAPRDKNGKFIPRATMAFWIRRSIYLAGIKPKKFFSDPFEQEYKLLPNKVTEAYALDVENFMDFTLNKAG